MSETSETQRLSQLLRERHITKNQLIEDLLVRVSQIEARVQALEANPFEAVLGLSPITRLRLQEISRQIDLEVAAALETPR